MTSYKKALFGIGLISLLMGSCTSDNVEELYGIPEDCDVSVVSYSLDVAPIIANNCTFSGCHLNPNAAAGRDWTTYAAVYDGKDLIRDRINRPVDAPGHMPKGGTLTTCEIKTITVWIDNGALNN